jgi:molybdate-binding protein/DNA-binding transcriptional regulator YhcF (GntR family)
MTDATSETGYQAIARRIRAEIARGQRQPGERLPSVRELARVLGVNVNTVARAYAELSREGSIESHRGSGSFIRSGPNDTQLEQRRAEQLRRVMAESVLRALSLGHTPADIEDAVRQQLGLWRAAATAAIAQPRGGQPGVIRFAGSHDLALELLAERLGRRAPPIDVELTFTGSTGGLMALLLNQADIAGCHLGHNDHAGDQDDQIRRVLPMHELVVVTLARRQQGLMVRPGNPLGIEQVADLTRTGAAIAVRQAGSGTRVLLEQLMVAEGQHPSLAGHPVFTTHAAAAAAIASGQADAGLGISAAARTYGLDFIPLLWERYVLVIPSEHRDDVPIRALVDTLRSDDFRQLMVALGGYDTTETATERLVTPSPAPAR